jgi:hypothetical protein
VHCSQNSQLKDEIDGVEQERDHLQARSSTPQLRHAGHVCQTFQQLDWNSSVRSLVCAG